MGKFALLLPLAYLFSDKKMASFSNSTGWSGPFQKSAMENNTQIEKKVNLVSRKVTKGTMIKNINVIVNATSAVMLSVYAT